MVQRLKSLWVKLKDYANRKTRIWQILPPYILLGIIWWASSSSNSSQDEADAERDQRAAAQQEYDADIIVYENLLDDRQACITAAETRTNSRETFFAIIDYATVNNPQSNQELHQIVEANQPSKMVSNCDVTNPVPAPPVPDPILLES